jgi:hypothetical protein
MHRLPLPRHARFVVATVIGAGLIAAAAPAQAQVKRAYYNQVGNWMIYSERNNRGALTRCYADLKSPSGLLRLSWNSNPREYWLSFPSPTNGQFGPAPVTMHFDRGYRATATSNRSNRPAFKLNSQMVDNLLRANETISLDFGGEWMTWPLNWESMENVFVSVENCVTGS